LVALAVVGPIASGKSTVLRMLAELGAATCSADEMARELTQVGQPALDRIHAEFGGRFRRGDGSLDRAGLGRLIFRDTESRERLEAILHPLILDRVGDWLDQQRDRSEPPPAAAAEVLRLPDELGARCHFDAVWLCEAPADVRLRRLIDRDGIRRSEAERRLSVQAAQGVEDCRADVTLDTGGSLESLRERVLDAWRDHVEGGAR